MIRPCLTLKIFYRTLNFGTFSVIIENNLLILLKLSIIDILGN